MYRVAVTDEGACLAQAVELMENDHGSAMWMEPEEFGHRLRLGKGVASAQLQYELTAQGANSPF
jgi:hypothetical protein